MFRHLFFMVILLLGLVACGTDTEVVTEYVELSQEKTSFKVELKSVWEGIDISEFSGADLVFMTEAGNRYSFDTNNIVRELTHSEFSSGVVELYTPLEYAYVYIKLHGYMYDRVEATSADYRFESEKVNFVEGGEHILKAYPTTLDNYVWSDINNYDTTILIDKYQSGCTIWTNETVLIRNEENIVKFSAICTDDFTGFDKGMSSVYLPITPSESGNLIFDIDVSDFNLYDDNGVAMEFISGNFFVVDHGSISFDGGFLLAEAEDISLTRLCFETPDFDLESVKLVSNNNIYEVYETLSNFYLDGENTCISYFEEAFIPKNDQLMLHVTDESIYVDYYPQITIVEGFGEISRQLIIGE